MRQRVRDTTSHRAREASSPPSADYTAVLVERRCFSGPQSAGVPASPCPVLSLGPELRPHAHSDLRMLGTRLPWTPSEADPW